MHMGRPRQACEVVGGCASFQIMRFLPALLPIVLWVTACASPQPAPVVKVKHTGLIQAWPEGLKDAKGKPAHFESSAVTRAGDRVFIASDKPAPRGDLSSLIEVKVVDLDPVGGVVPLNQVKQVGGETWRKAKKIESMTPLGDGRYLAISAFDREEPGFNSLVVWQGTKAEDAAGGDCLALRRPLRLGLMGEAARGEWISNVHDVLYPESRVPTGVLARDASSLPIPADAPPYFKIEGLAVSKPGTLMMGVREYGQGYKPGEFQYSVKLLEGALTLDSRERSPGFRPIRVKGLGYIGPDFRPTLEVTSQELRRQGIRRTVAISSLEADPHGGLWALLSYEEEEGEVMGAYLLRILQQPGDRSHKPRWTAKVVKGVGGRPFHFPHKAEGMCFLDDRHLLIVADEDRRQAPVLTKAGPITRTPSQCVYAVLETE